VRIEMPYGKTTVFGELPPEWKVGICRPVDILPAKEPTVLIRQALNNPIASKPFPMIVGGGRTVCIVVNDITRSTPSHLLLKPLVEDLLTAGISIGDITILIANGNHRPCTPDEVRQIVGQELMNCITVVNHEAGRDEDLVYLGDTDGGVPIHVNRHLVEADIRILTGTIRPHQSAGYSGGRKSVLPGVAGLKSICKHHSFPIFPLEPVFGRIHGNTFHDESLAGAKKVGIHFILNIIENSQGQIIDAVAGDLELAHLEGVRRSANLWKVPIPQRVDVAIVSPGGYPKDINLHQAQKAIAPCELVLRPGGVIILVAQCPDGPGYISQWFEGLDSAEAVIAKFKRDGWSPKAHAKPFLLARPLSKFTVIVVTSGISPKDLQNMFMIHASSLQNAICKTQSLIGTVSPSVLVMPYAGDVIPELPNEKIISSDWGRGSET
jgi:nickel-dependent lactate racemase